MTLGKDDVLQERTHVRVIVHEQYARHLLSPEFCPALSMGAVIWLSTTLRDELSCNVSKPRSRLDRLSIWVARVWPLLDLVGLGV
jgi:hypothetical protein